MGIALLTIQFLNTFTQPGFASAMIQKPDLEDREIVTAWWVSWGGACYRIDSMGVKSLDCRDLP